MLIVRLVNEFDFIQSDIVIAKDLQRRPNCTFKIFHRRGRGLVPVLVFHHPHWLIVTIGMAVETKKAVVIGFVSRGSW